MQRRAETPFTGPNLCITVLSFAFLAAGTAVLGSMLQDGTLPRLAAEALREGLTIGRGLLFGALLVQAALYAATLQVLFRGKL